MSWNYRRNKDSSINFLWKKASCETQLFFFTFLLITIAFLIAVSIYCYVTKYRTKQKHVLPYHITNHQVNKCIIKVESNDKLKEVDIKNRTLYYFNDIIKIEDFDFDNI